MIDTARKENLYLDTSVPSAYRDRRAPRALILKAYEAEVYNKYDILSPSNHLALIRPRIILPKNYPHLHSPILLGALLDILLSILSKTSET